MEHYFNNIHEKNIIDNLTNNSNNNLNSEMYNLWLKSYKSCEKILNAYKVDKSLLKGKVYKDFIGRTPSEVIFSIVLTNVLPNILKNDVLNDQHITMLCDRIGGKLIKAYFHYEYDLYKKWCGEMDCLIKQGRISTQIDNRYKFNDEILIDKDLDYNEFISYLPLSKYDLKDVDLIKYGFDMVDIVSLNSNLFSINTEYNPIEKTTLRYISFTDSGKQSIIDFLADDIQTFPMITPPNDWDIDILNENGDYNITKYGGYISNIDEQQSFNSSA